MKIEIDSFLLERFDENDPSHLLFEDKLLSSNEGHFVKQISERLHRPSREEGITLEQAYFVTKDNHPIGYLYITGMEHDRIYLEYLILKEERRKGYASDLLQSISYYLFQHFPVEKVLLDIDHGNYPSMKTAEAAGFYYDEEEYLQGNGRLTFERSNPYYQDKRKKGR